MGFHSMYSGFDPVIDLFTRNKRYEVPRFQREYSWAGDQITDFIDDIRFLSNADRSQKEPYFFGPMVFVFQDSDENNYDLFKIVDGQQRLTTSAIFIAVIRDILFEMKKKREALEFNRHIQEENLETGEIFDRIILSERNKDFFKNHILSKDTSTVKLQVKPDPPNELLHNAYRTLYNEFRLDDSKHLISICEKFVRYFTVIQISVPSYDHASKIFETLNARGLDLSQGDLVKNYILEKSMSTELEDEIFDIWITIVNTLDVIGMDDFLRHFWLAKGTTKIKKNQIYKTLIEHVPKEIPVDEFVKQLKTHAEIYKSIIEPKKIDWWGNEQIIKYLKILGILNSKVCYVPLLVGRRKLNETDFLQLIKLCVNFFFRYKTICRLHATQLENMMIMVADDLRKDVGIDLIKTKRFLDRKIYPDDPTFRSAFANSSLGDKISIYVLSELYDLPVMEQMYIEHIMPRNVHMTKWGTDLKPAIGASKDPNDDLKSYVAKWHSRLGNITLMEKNTVDKKRPYAEKHTQFYSKSSLQLTKELPQTSVWDHEQIKIRQEKFAEKAVEMWKIS